MFKKILIITGYTLLFAAAIAYFVLATIITKREKAKIACKRIEVTIIDSTVNRFVCASEIREKLRIEGITQGESKLKHINQYELERVLNNINAVKRADLTVNIKGIVKVFVQQRTPVLRLETTNGGFYLDGEGYIFPLVKRYTSNVPVVTGAIPVVPQSGYKGYIKKGGEWIKEMRNLGLFIAKNSIWDSHIEQIDIDQKGDLHLIPRIGGQEIIFGNLDNMEYKFKKLYAFYQSVIPQNGWNKYKRIDLRFGAQIVCKKRIDKS